jgi:hypothetical protein
MKMRPRQTRFHVYEVIRDPIAGPLTHNQPGHTLRALRELHGDVVPVVDPLTRATYHFRLDRWGTSDPEKTLISWSFHHSALPRWLWRLR